MVRVKARATIHAADGGFYKLLILDGKGHLRGRLAAVVAKKLLQGQKIVVLRCEEINISGSLYRNKIEYGEFRRKRMNTNPKKGPFHYKQPSKMFWRTVRGMLPHKLKRGADALKRLQTFEGVPPRFAAKRKLVAPHALKVMKLEPGRNFCKLGDLAAEVGWKFKDIVADLEVKRKALSEVQYEKRNEHEALRLKAVAAAKGDLAPYDKLLLEYGYTPL